MIASAEETRAIGSGVIGGPGAELPPGAPIGEWRVESKIGEGGMGTVYAASHAVIGKRAALKVIRADALLHDGAAERLLQEARVVNQIDHRNIVDVFEVGTLEDGRPYLVMELLEGRTLGDRLAAERIPALEAIEILGQVCAALAAAHARGVIHRDLKPDNVLLVEGAGGVQVKLLDWGIAKMAAPDVVDVTGAGTFIGTPRYMSPEQARGRAVSERTDVYALGAIAYELFLEEPPFTCDNIADLLAAHLREPVLPPRELWPDVPAALDALLVAMLAKEPAGRPGLDEVVETLGRVRQELRRRAGLITGGGEPVPAAANVAVAAGGWSHLVPPLPERAALLETQDASTLAPSPRSRRGAVLAGVGVIAATLAALALFVRGGAPAVAPTSSALVATADAAAPAVPPSRPPSSLDLRVTPGAAVVTVDGTALSLTSGRARRPLDQGRHTVRIRADGFVPYERTVDVGPGPLLLAVELERLAPRRTAPAPAHPSSKRRSPRIHPDATIDPYR